MKKSVLIIPGVMVVVIGGWLWYRQAHAATGKVQYVTAAASQGTLVSSVSGSGNVIVDQTVKVVPSITGTVTGLSVNLGDQVKKGQTLFSIVNNQLDINVSKSYAGYLQAEQALSTAQAGLITAQANYTNQAQDAGQAKAQAGLDQANTQLVTAQAELSQDQQTLSSTDSGASNYSTLQNKVTTDQATVTADQANLKAAQIALDQAKTSAAATVNFAKQQVHSAQTGVQIAEQNLEVALADYNNQKAIAAERTVTAPIDGSITALNIGNGDQLGSAGASSSTPIVISDLSTIKASVAINEVDAPQVQVGQKASLTFDAIDGLTLTGKVKKMDTVGTVNQGVVTYNATIDFDSLDSRVKPGMSTSATITTSVKQDVLMVPSEAVKSDAGGSYVQLLQNGEPVRQNVQVGASSDTDTEITSGLTSGTKVITQTIQPTSTSTGPSSSRSLGLGGLGGGRTQVFTSSGRGSQSQ